MDVTTSPKGAEPSRGEGVPEDPLSAAKRYGRPGPRSGYPAREIPPGSVGPTGATPSDDRPAAQESKLPMILGILGILGWFVCGVGVIASFILGGLGQRKAHELGQSDLLPKIAWIGGIVVTVLNAIGLLIDNAIH